MGEAKDGNHSARALRVELITRDGCPLCDEALDALRRVRDRQPFELVIRDVDSDPDLLELYDVEVPVVLIEGRKAFKYRVDEAVLERRIRGGGFWSRFGSRPGG